MKMKNPQMEKLISKGWVALSFWILTFEASPQSKAIDSSNSHSLVLKVQIESKAMQSTISKVMGDLAHRWSYS